MTGPDVRPPAESASEAPVGELISRASEQISQLVREEIHLATAEMTRKGKRFGIGGGLFSGAALMAFIALQAATATAIAALSLVVPVWAAALIGTGVLLAVAGVAAAAGKRQVSKAIPPTPQQTIDSVKADMAVIKERAHR